MKNVMQKISSAYVALGQRVGSVLNAPTRSQTQVALFVLGVALLSFGTTKGLQAQALEITYNDERISNSVNAILLYIEGSFGALIMVASGLTAIMSAAFGQYKAALGCLVVAVGAFILRSVLGTFFNDETIRE